jgi:hypothetical protein
MSILFGVTAFVFLFGIRRIMPRIILGVFVLFLEALFVPRPVQFALLGQLAHAILFVILGIIAILSYRGEGYRYSAGAGLPIVVLGIVQAGSGIPFDPVFNLVFAVRWIINGVSTGLFLEVLSASTGNLAISILWGFLLGDMFFVNGGMGKYYSEQGNRLLGTLFFVTQSLTITYLMLLLFKVGTLASRIIEGDQLYLVFDVITLFLMLYFLVAKIKWHAMREKWSFCRLIFVIVGTTFLIPALYPILDGILRSIALFSFVRSSNLIQHVKRQKKIGTSETCASHFILRQIQA